MPQQNYLLFIDHEPINENLIRYFLHFNIDIVQQYQLDTIQNKLGSPDSILIHWSFLKKEPQVIHQLYSNYLVPLIVINNTPDEEGCIKALEAGADDFLIKPLNPREVHARVSAINRRILRVGHQSEHEKDVYVFSNWRLYPASRQLFNNKNEELLLSAGEYDLLLKFIKQPNQILDRELLLHMTRHNNINSLDRRIDVQISRLRQKIDLDIKKPSLIKTIRNEGYMLTTKVRLLKERE